MQVKIPAGGIKVDGITWPEGEMEASGKLANKLFPFGATLISRDGLEGIETAPDGIGAGTSAQEQVTAAKEKKKSASRKSRSA